MTDHEEFGQMFYSDGKNLFAAVSTETIEIRDKNDKFLGASEVSIVPEQRIIKWKGKYYGESMESSRRIIR